MLEVFDYLHQPCTFNYAKNKCVLHTEVLAAAESAAATVDELEALTLTLSNRQSQLLFRLEFLKVCKVATENFEKH